MTLYEIAVIGAGAAGSMAAMRAGMRRHKTVLLERTSNLGNKILITGKGRCNITNTASLDTFMGKFGKQGKFLRNALSEFSNNDLIALLGSAGLKVKAERQGRVFPVTDSAKSVTSAITKLLTRYRVNILYDMRMRSIIKRTDAYEISFFGRKSIHAQKVIIATGGLSYKVTGSTGDGLRIAECLGHRITELNPGLVPLKAKEGWVKSLQGLTLKNIRLSYKSGNKRHFSSIGEVVFTHFGISGPLVLDLSRDIVSLLSRQKEVAVSIDIKPGLDENQIEARLLRDLSSGSMNFSNLLKSLLPRKLIPVFIRLSGIDPAKKISQITRKERMTAAGLLKSLPLTIIGALALEEAMVTAGGVSTKDIDPRTMESKILSGLYFAGEVIDGCAPSGGYNLQMAFSTGWLAGEKSADSLKIDNPI